MKRKAVTRAIRQFVNALFAGKLHLKQVFLCGTYTHGKITFMGVYCFVLQMLFLDAQVGFLTWQMDEEAETRFKKFMNNDID